jgi:nucleotide-binding universal stress UspA family protein
MVTIQTVLVAVDLSDLSPSVLGYASSLALAWDAQLVVVHVAYDLSYFTSAFLSGTPLPELQQRLEIEADERLRSLCQTELGDQVRREVLVVTGRPVAEISRLMKELAADCLVIGAHSTEKPEHQLFGSTVERLMHLSPCPIFMIPPYKESYVISYR